MTKVSTDLSVLIVGYRRAENIAKILEICKMSGIKDIYLSIDGPKNENIVGLADYNQIIKVIEDFKMNFQGSFFSYIRKSNVGCAASVMSSCDWFFSQVNYGAVLEDDCIPSSSFFEFCKMVRMNISDNPSIWLACGTQFAPRELFLDSPIISKYALTWGWVTSSKKWQLIKESMYSLEKVKYSKLHKPNVLDKIYWAAGSRRAYQGLTDVWDTVLVYRMQLEGKFAILPSENLVTNTGNDFAATHTLNDSPFLNLRIGRVKEYNDVGKSRVVDKWIKKNVYSISARHFVTTRATHFADFLRNMHKPMNGLLKRWDDAKIF